MGYILLGNDSWEVASVDGKIQKTFQTKEGALAFLKTTFGESVQYIEQEATVQRWAD